MQSGGDKHRTGSDQARSGAGSGRRRGGNRGLHGRSAEGSWERMVQQHFGSNYVDAILSPQDPNGLLDNVRKFASDLYALDIAHFRSLLGYLKKSDDVDFFSIRWMAAAIAGRGGRDREGDQLRTLAFLIDRLAQKAATSDKSAALRLRQFVESVVAYHRFYHAK